MLTLILALTLTPSEARVVSRCRGSVVAPKWINKATVRSGLFKAHSSISEPGKKYIHPTDSDIKKMDQERKNLADHCFGPSCNIAKYANVPELSVDTRVHHVHPVDDMVREMERKRKELAEHCFGPACNVEHYKNLGVVDEVNAAQDNYRINPWYANREEMERKRKELQEHCFGPSCSTEHYEKMKIPEVSFSFGGAAVAEQPKRAYPGEETVREMERQRKALAKHCFGPSCNIKMYEKVPRALAYLNQRNQN